MLRTKTKKKKKKKERISPILYIIYGSLIQPRELFFLSVSLTTCMLEFVAVEVRECICDVLIEQSALFSWLMNETNIHYIFIKKKLIVVVEDFVTSWK
jgi:hypothetical protein